MNPILDLWQALTSSTPGLINRRAGAASSGPGGAGLGAKKLLDPVDDFVNMENELAGDICSVVDGALAALKKVSNDLFCNNYLVVLVVNMLCCSYCRYCLDPVY